MKCALCDKDLSKKDLETHIGNIHDGHKNLPPVFTCFTEKNRRIEIADMSHGPSG